MTTTKLRASLRTWRIKNSIRKSLLASAERDLANARRRDLHPRQPLVSLVAKRKKQVAEAERLIGRRTKQLRKTARARSDRRWGGSRYYTNRANDLVNKHRPGTRTTSRKRPVLLGNTGSDHNFTSRTADARDWALVNDHAMKNIISRENGGPNSIADFGTWTTRRNGHTYRHQIIAGTHGTGPHLHYGVKRS